MKLLQWLKRLFMALSLIIKNFFNSLCCGADPCAGKQGFTSVVLAGNSAEFYGGTGDLPTEWQVVRDGIVTQSGTLLPGNWVLDDSLPTAPFVCFTLRWKSPCDNAWREQQSLGCGQDVCEFFIPYTTAIASGFYKSITFSGGTNNSPTEWEILEDGQVINNGTMPPGSNYISWMQYDENKCYLLRWKNDCEDAWHEQQIGDCSNPCAGYEPFTNFNYTGEDITLTGGNAIGTTAWEVVQDGSVVASGTLQPAEDTFTVPGFNPATCQTIRFKGVCEDSWHEFTIGDCADPCAGYEPFTDFDYTGEDITLTGGNAIGTTAWEMVQDGAVVASGTLQPGEDTYTAPGFNPATCQTIRFKGACEDSWHEFTIGDCTPSYLAPGNYSMDYGAVTGVCDIELSVSRLPEARDAAIAAGVRIKCNWTANNDNGSLPCSYTGETIFEPTDGTIDLGVYDISCGGISACSMMGSFTINSLEIVP
jgi:hypothetical protein